MQAVTQPVLTDRVTVHTVSPGVFSATCSKNHRSSIAVKPLKSNAIVYVNAEERYITPNVTQTAESPRLNQVPFARQHHAQETQDGETPGQAVTAHCRTPKENVT